MENPNTYKKIEVLCAGEALIDLVADGSGQSAACLGGAVYNLARALALQGIGVGYLNPLSNDLYGQQLRAQLLADGASVLEGDAVQESTSLAVVNVDNQGKPNYVFYREDIADRATTSERLSELSNRTNAQLVCTGCLALSPDDASIYLPWLDNQKRMERTIAMDVNVRSVVMKDQAAYKVNIHKALQYADIIKASDDDLAYLDMSAADLLAKTSAQIVLLTLGAGGAQILTRQGESLAGQSPYGLQVIDTVGAGDCFFAGFLAYWLKNKDVENFKLAAALAHAIASASINCIRLGCQPPTWNEVIEAQSAW